MLGDCIKLSLCYLFAQFSLLISLSPSTPPPPSMSPGSGWDPPSADGFTVRQSKKKREREEETDSDKQVSVCVHKTVILHVPKCHF